jgi:hypothetical protein
MHKIRSLRKLEEELSKIEKRIVKADRSPKNKAGAAALKTNACGQDGLNFVDYYKLAGSDMAFPPRLFGYGLLITSLLFFTPIAFEFTTVVERYVSFNWMIFVMLLVMVHTVIILRTCIRAIWLWYIFNQLPFRLNGLGLLVHSCKGPHYFRRCALHIVWDKEKIQLHRSVMGDIEKGALAVLADKAQATISGKPISQKWVVKDQVITGFANWNVGRKLLICMFRYIAPVQQETRAVLSIELTLPDTGSLSDNYYEWSAEGD